MRNPPRMFQALRRLLLLLPFLLCAAASLTAQTINPADYGTITLHLKADALSLSNNASVTTWQSSAAGGPLTASGTNTPTYIASDSRFNNKPVVRFDGTDDVMKWTTANMPARTIFAVTTVESSAANLAGLLSTGADKLNIRRNGTTNFYRSPGASQDTNDFTGVGSPTGNLYVNTIASGSFTPGVAHIVMAVAGTQQTYGSVWLGSPSASLARYWNGSVAELIVYDGVLTADGINKVGWYLQNKYNITNGGYPPPQPQVTSFTATNAGQITSSTGVTSTAGASVTLSWNVQSATNVAIDNGALAGSSSATGTVTVSPTVTTTYTLTASNSFGSATKTVTVYIGVTPQLATLNEFVADADSRYPDEDGDNSDWIEIYNPNPYAIDLQGYQLRDSVDTWVFPAGSGIEANGYRVIFASGKNRVNPAANLHTNFALNSDGEYLALKSPTGTVITEFTPAYPPQRKGASGGIASGGAYVYYPTPTPGAANVASVIGFVEDTSFSVRRGFFTTAFQTTITTTTPGATIRYTLNASTPTETNGIIYTGPITISGTTTLRARAFLTNYAPTNTDTQTYIFLADVLNQTYPSTPPTGWPVSGVNGQVLRYGWNSTLKAQYTNQQLLDGLSQIPSISIVTDQANLTSAATGIYVNALEKSDSWERATSVEYLPPDNSTGFHVNAGLRIRGGYSRNDQFPKHSLRLFFRAQYGDSKLKFPLHGVSGTDEFETLDLRTEQNYHWANDSGTQNTAVREVFCRDLMGAMGQPTTRSRYVHLYLNGQYWGLYQTEERPQEDYGATYLGGKSGDYDVVQTSNHPDFTYELAAGTLDAWQTTWNMARAHAASPTAANYFAIQGRDPNGARNLALPVYVDVDSLITYMLVNYYVGDGDAPLSNFLSMNMANNWRVLRNRLTDQGWRYFVHDSEHTLQATSWVDNRPNTNAPNGSNRGNFTYSNSEWIHEDLSANAEYRIRFADIAQKYLFNSGAMTSAKAQALFDARAAQINQAIVADVARWGTNSTNHTLAQWNSRLASIRTGFFPSRAANLISYLRTRGFYPAVDAPTFSQHGGQVATGYSLTLSAGVQTGTIYYTTDGSDPRAIGGTVAVGALTYSGPITISQNNTFVRTRFRSSGGVWSALDEGLFTFYPPAIAGKLVVSKLHYHPSDPTTAESLAGYSASDFEYIELLNISSETLDMHGVTISGGVSFSFTTSPVQSLAPGARVLVVGNVGAFAMRYGNGPVVAGAFTGSLSNSGETLRVADANDVTIVQFTYGTDLPWPSAPDGSGPALVLINPTLNPDPNGSANWRTSAAAGGSPGASDAVVYSDWATSNTVADLVGTGDDDKDGGANMVEYALGTDPRQPSRLPISTGVQLVTVNAVANEYLTISFTRPIGRDSCAVNVEATGDLSQAWTSGVQVGQPVSLGNGSEIWTYRYPMPRTTGAQQYLRLRITRVQ